MSRLSLFILAIGCLALLPACTPGESKLTSGEAAGAGISALLGSGGNSSNSGSAGGSQADPSVPVTGEDGLRYYGPL